MPFLFVILFAVLWYFLGFWLAVAFTLIGIAAVFKPDLIFVAIGLGLLAVFAIAVFG